MERMTRLSGRQASSNSPLPFLKYNLESANLLPSSFSYFLNYKTKPLSYKQWTQHLNTCNCCDGSTFIFFGLPGPAVTLSSSSAPTLVPGSLLLGPQDLLAITCLRQLVSLVLPFDPVQLEHRMVDSISLMIEFSSTGQSPSKFLIIGLRLARILEFEGKRTPSLALETRIMSFSNIAGL